MTQTLLTQIELSKIAVRETENEKVREYAGWLLKDYEPALAKLNELAAKTNLEAVFNLDASHHRIVESFKQKPQKQRDYNYLLSEKDQHDDLIMICEKARDEATIAVELRDFGDNLLPTLKQYQKRAEKLLQMTPTLSNSQEQKISRE